MMGTPASLNTLDLRQLLRAMAQGDQGAQAKLVGAYYEEFRRLARNMSRTSETMRPTVLVNEVFLKLLGAQQVQFEDRKHFHYLAACIMRNVLRDYYRKRSRRPAKGNTVPIEDWYLIAPKTTSDFLDVDEAIHELERQYPRKAQVVLLRVFAGCSVAETAETLQITQDRVNRDFSQARVFLRRRLLDEVPPDAT